MKAIICFCNGAIHIRSFHSEWTEICKNTRAKWLDPVKGTVVVAAHNPDKVRLLGLHNTYLIGAIDPEGHGNLAWPEYRALHDQATEMENYVFNKDRIGCWAAVVRVGHTSDVRWANETEYEEAFAAQAVT